MSGVLGPAFSQAIDEGLDVGPEVGIVQSFHDGGSATAVAVDLAVGFYLDRAVAEEAAIPDRLLGKSVPPRWSFLARQAIALHVGGVFDVEHDRQQVHVAAGSGVGPLGLALAFLYEAGAGPNAVALGPELRLRHRFGPSKNTWSVGILARGEIFVHQRDAHPDRATVGAFVMFGW